MAPGGAVVPGEATPGASYPAAPPPPPPLPAPGPPVPGSPGAVPPSGGPPAPSPVGNPPPTHAPARAPGAGLPTPALVLLVVVVALILLGGAVMIFSGGDEAAGPPVTVDKELDPALLPDEEGSSSASSTSASSTSETSTVPPSSQEVPPEGPAWRTFTASDGSYRVDFPGAPTSEVPREVDGVVTGRETIYEDGRVFYAVFAYRAEPGVFEGAADPRDVVLAIVDGLDADAGITVRQRTFSEFQGLPAVDFSGSGRGYFIDGAGVVAGDRVYLLVAGGIAGDHDFERFRSSFALTG